MNKKAQDLIEEDENSKEVISALDARKRERSKDLWAGWHSAESTIVTEPLFEDGESWKI